MLKTLLFMESSICYVQSQKVQAGFIDFSFPGYLQFDLLKNVIVCVSSQGEPLKWYGLVI